MRRLVGVLRGGVALGAIVGFGAGCGSAALRAAEQGDQAQLRSAIAEKHQRGALTNGEAADLARAVAQREITSAKSPADASLRLGEIRACAHEVDDALDERMKTHDGPGAEAALERLEAGDLGSGRARDFLDDADDRWRAVGTRALHQDGDGPRRRKAMLDPSPKVRRSALRAAADAKDAADLDVLYESARLDPELLLRNESIRAMSAIVRREKGRAGELATRLRDLWTSGDDAVREEIAVAWALSPVFEAGGRDALRVLLSAEHGPGALAAAAVVSRTAKSDRELAASASALVARTILEGSRRDRLHAIVIAQTEGVELAALDKATADEDLDVRIPALGKLLDAPAHRERAKKTLLSFASYGVRGAPQNPPGSDDDRYRRYAARARMSLAQRGELRVQAWIEEDLASPAADRRLGAVQALAALGRPARGAPLLADADPSVRTRAACTILVASRSR